MRDEENKLFSRFLRSERIAARRNDQIKVKYACERRRPRSRQVNALPLLENNCEGIRHGGSC